MPDDRASAGRSTRRGTVSAPAITKSRSANQITSMQPSGTTRCARSSAGSCSHRQATTGLRADGRPVLAMGGEHPRKVLRDAVLRRCETPRVPVADYRIPAGARGNHLRDRDSRVGRGAALALVQALLSQCGEKEKRRDLARPPLAAEARWKPLRSPVHPQRSPESARTARSIGSRRDLTRRDRRPLAPRNEGVRGSSPRVGSKRGIGQAGRRE